MKRSLNKRDNNFFYVGDAMRICFTGGDIPLKKYSTPGAVDERDEIENLRKFIQNPKYRANFCDIIKENIPLDDLKYFDQLLI